MRIIGLTGGLASGKSTVSSYLKSKGIPVIDCDYESRCILQKGERGYSKAVEAFGEEILQPNGEIDRKKLASIIFKDEALVQKLNAIVHPEVIIRTHELLSEYQNQGCEIAVVDAPLLIEAGMHKICHELWVVYTSPETQIKRAMARDNSTLEQVQERIKNQMPLEEKARLADVLISNEGTLEELYNRVDEVLKE